jgi:hypothetical protein
MPEPYSYELVGHHGIRVTFTPRGAGAVPAVTYADSTHAEQSFVGTDRVSIIDGPAGELVSVTLQAIPDGDTTDFAFLAPRINLPEGTDHAPVRTIGFTALHRDTIAGPPPSGQIDLYWETALVGCARNGGIHPL